MFNILSNARAADASPPPRAPPPPGTQRPQNRRAHLARAPFSACSKAAEVVLRMARGNTANGMVRHGVMVKHGTNKRQTGTHIIE